MSESTTDQGAAGEPAAPGAASAAAPTPREPARDRAAEGPPRPKIGDTRPAPVARTPAGAGAAASNGAAETGDGAPAKPRRRRRGGRGRGGASRGAGQATRAEGGTQRPAGTQAETPRPDGPSARAGGRGAQPRNAPRDSVARAPEAPAPRTRGRAPAEDEDTGDDLEGRAGQAKRRRGRERNGRPIGRYLMCVHVRPEATQIAVLEGRSLIEHHVARSQDDVNQIDGNLYRGRVKNVLPGMEAAFVDIGTPKNAVLYWGDVQFDRDDAVERDPGATRIEHLLRPGQSIVCQVTKNPIGLKGARLTEEVSLPGRFVVLVPNSTASGISKRLDDGERKRLRKILEDIRPEGHGVIIRTAAEGVSEDELRRDVDQLLAKWAEIEEKAKRLPAPALLYSEPHLALRVIREEFTEEFRGIVIDDRELYELVRAYVADIDPSLADRVELFDTDVEPLPLFERHHVHEQLHKALDRKVWLPSGGSLIIERTEALTVIDVNTGKNVGSSSLEETVFRNNLEAAEEIARQLRLRDIGGIIVIDFIDMEVKSNRQEVTAALRGALARDKTPTQAFDISELGLVEMTRKRIGEGLVEALSEVCPMCKGRGIVFQDLRD